MSESQESIRRDSAVRQIEEKEVQDWSGKRLILPNGTTLPAVGRNGEVFVLVKAAGQNQLYNYDETVNNWVTVGP